MDILGFIRSIQQRDEAKPTTMEVVLAYPGFHVMVLFHPLAHFLWGIKLFAIARIWASIGRFITGIDIHPGATIGKNLFIDHGTGVVIGQTAIIGDDCRLYHCVTLGGRGGDRSGRRHPIVGNRVIIGAGATVLGSITIGNDAKIGANSLVLKDVPDEYTAMGNPARLLGKIPTDHCHYGISDYEI